MKVGDVSTAEITDATPAVLASHISLRGCQGPANMAACPTETKAAGGLGSIAEQEVDHKVDVLLGGGRTRFTQTIDRWPDAGKTVVQSAQAKGYQLRRPTPTGLGRRRRTEQTGPRPLQHRQHVARVERPGRRDSARATRPPPCTEGAAAGERAEPGRR